MMTFFINALIALAIVIVIALGAIIIVSVYQVVKDILKKGKNSD
ncbi:hypothetical protein [Lactococcus allomyrinae]|nr:hypothetical protein [Lactococcus allomyrinae]